jgi:L-histidine N-alpha-methyltransferase
VLRVINAGVAADFERDAFEHVAFFDEANSWIEMRLRADGAGLFGLAFASPRP